MNPQKLTIEGAKGILAGTGLKRLDIDLTTIPSDALTVAIRGDNGSGKSTLLNLAMTPWREPPQLPGNVYAEFLDEGFRELVWGHAGQTYRSRIQYKQTPKTKQQRAFLHTMARDKWAPVCLPDGMSSDGKASTYDACLEHILGPQDIYYLAAFRAQNAPKLAEYDDPKGLMRALLALEEPEKLRTKSAEVTRELRREMETLRERRHLGEDPSSRAEILRQNLAHLRAETSRWRSAKAVASNEIAKARAELDAVMARGIDEQRIRDQRAEISNRLHDDAEKADRAITSAAGHLRAAEKRIEAHGTETLSALETLAGDIRRAELRIENYEKIMERGPDIRRAERVAVELAKEIEDKELEEKDLETQIAEISALRRSVENLEAEKKAFLAAMERLRDQREDLRLRSGFFERVPCRGAGKYAQCPALLDAKEASEKLKDVDGELNSTTAEHYGIMMCAEGMEKEIENAGDPASIRDRCKADLRELNARLNRARRIATDSVLLDQASEARAQAIEDAEEIIVRRQKVDDAMATGAIKLRAEIDAAQAALASLESEKKIALARLQGQLDAIPVPTVDHAIAAAQRSLSDAEERYQNAIEGIESNTASVAQVDASIASAQLESVENAALDAQAEKLGDELAKWTLLGSALRGVVDLSIEAAGPAIAELANRLLKEAYGPRFTVRIVTQREQANGRLVECFDISVIDSETETEASITHKSGGENVWLDKALTDAVGLYHQEATGVRYECKFADEAEDGLTQERKNQFYRMDRAALELGGYVRKYSVSHDPEAWAQADYVLDMPVRRHDGGETRIAEH